MSDLDNQRQFDCVLPEPVDGRNELLDVQRAVGHAVKKFIKTHGDIGNYVSFGKPKKNKTFTLGFVLRKNDGLVGGGGRNLNIGGKELFFEVKVDGVKDFDGVYFATVGTRISVRIVVGNALIPDYQTDKDKQLVSVICSSQALKNAFSGASVEEIAEAVVKGAWDIVFFDV